VGADIARRFFRHLPAVARMPRQAADEPINLAAGLEAIQASQAAYLLLVDLSATAKRPGQA